LAFLKGGAHLSNRHENKGKSGHGTQRDAQKLDSSIAEVKRVIIAWPKLDESLKAAILAIVKSLEVGQ
jgi:hypothetical protein